MAQSAGVPRRAGFVEGMLFHVDGGVGCSMPGQIDENIPGELVVGSTQASRGCFAFVKGIVGVGAPPSIFGGHETFRAICTAWAGFTRSNFSSFDLIFKIIAIDFTTGVQTVKPSVAQETKFTVVGALDFTPYTIRAIN